MTSLRNRQVSGNTIYRELYQRSEEHHLDGEDRHRAGMEANSKWAFMKRLLEIEEEHDKRRKARERTERALKQATGTRLIAPDRVQPSSKMRQVDPSDKWFNGQILTTEPDVDIIGPEQDGSISYRLPPVFGNVTSNTSQTNNPHMMRESSKSPDGNQHSLFSNYETSVGTEDKQELVSHHHEHASLSHLKTKSHSNLIGLSSLDNELSEENQASLGSFQREQSRQMSAPKKRRQLRLPPILLPRVYTVKPRPLKALEFPAPTVMPGPISQAQWEDLRECRYIRHTTPRAKRSFNLKQS